MRRAKVIGGVAVAMGVSMFACFDGDEPLIDLFRKDGNSAEGYFFITPAPGSSTRLVKGGKIDWKIVDYEGDLVGANAKPRDVSVSDPERLGLEGTSGAVVTTSGKGAGSASVRFQGDADGDALRDSFPVEVFDAVGLNLQHCDLDAVYVRGVPAFVDIGFVDAGSQIGYGYGYYPVTLTPAADGVVNLDNRVHNAMRVDISEEAGESLTIASALDGDMASLTMPLINIGDITSVTVSSESTLTPGLPVALDLDVRAGTQRVCAPLAATISVETPSSCSVSGGAPSGQGTTVFMHGVQIQGLGSSSSTCRLKITLVAAGLAAAIVRVIDYEVPVTVPTSSGGGGGDFD